MNAAPEAQALQIAENAYQVALAVEVDSMEMFELAGSELQSIKKRAKEIDELRLSLTRPLDDSKKRIMDLFRGPLARLEEAEGLIRKGMLQFQQAERAKQEQARREVEAQARREREQLEAQRREAERVAAEAAAAGDTAAANAAAAVAEQAADAIELAEVAPVALPTVAAVKASGISTRENWKHEVNDFAALVIAAGKAAEQGDTTLLGYLQPKDTAIGQVARALKSSARIPGVRVYAEEGLAVRAA